MVAAGGSAQRGEMRCRIVHRGWQRDFLGFNRARAAVIEVAILATRLHLLERSEVAAALDRCETVVHKTGDAAEHTALLRIREFTRDWLDENSN